MAKYSVRQLIRLPCLGDGTHASQHYRTLDSRVTGHTRYMTLRCQIGLERAILALIDHTPTAEIIQTDVRTSTRSCGSLNVKSIQVRAIFASLESV